MANETSVERSDIRYLGDVQRLVLNAGDIVVLSSNRPVSQETADKIKLAIERQIPGHKVLVLDDSLKIGVLGST